VTGEVEAKRGTYAGLFLVALATLMYEILLTRIFSVTIWYHLAFVAISVAMFGMTVGAIIVYLSPNYFSRDRVLYQLSLGSLWLAISAIASFMVHLTVRFYTQSFLLALVSIGFTYAVISIPFIFSGICVCLALTRFPRQVSKLYAADLAGAALGCILLIYTLRITDGPTAVMVVSLLAAIASVCFAADAGVKRLRQGAVMTTVALAILVVGHTILVHMQAPLLRLIWVKGGREGKPLYEKWNSFSRIQVRGNPSVPESPLGFAFSPAFPIAETVGQLHLNIDACAGTVLTRFENDDPGGVDFLKLDLTNFVHYLRRDARVLVVGVGGGRDILSALAFDQKSVTGVEINEEILKTVNGKFGDFTGHLDKNPRVTFVNDEARSYIARSKDKFDIIQISFIDTWAATAAGAYVLAESPLYTVEAWKSFLEHLTPNGILTVSRWYYRQRPGEVYRLTTLAVAALKQIGVTEPRNHIAILRRVPPPPYDYLDGVGTILVSPQPFSERDQIVFDDTAQKMLFEVVLTPRFALDDTFAAIASGEDFEQFVAQFPLNISPPTDDSPFFFQMLRLRDVLNRMLQMQGAVTFNLNAVFILAALLVTVAVLTLLCIIVPLILTSRKEALQGALPLFLFFAGIGFGFMLVEISQLQRLIVFLGHPTYGLSVVLFSLLLSSGLGSFLTGAVGPRAARGSGTVRLLLLLAVLMLFGLFTPYAIRQYSASGTPLRILVATATLLPLGLFMGMAFPLGMKVASFQSALLTPWLWGINGATSVCASVLAVVIALASGISTAFWTGFACYFVATLGFVWAGRGTAPK